MSISHALLSSVNRPPWDIKSARLKQSLTIADAANVFFKPDGLVMFVLSRSGANDAVLQYSLSSAWDISTASYVKQRLISSGIREGMYISADGRYMFLSSRAARTIYRYFLSTPWDVSGFTSPQTFNVSVQVPQPYGLFLKPDGTRFYLTEDQTGSVNNVNQWDISAWSLSGASYAGFASTILQNTGPRDVFFKPDGLKMYATNVVDKFIQGYDLSTAWDVTTASYNNEYIDVGADSVSPYGLFMRDDGRKMYIVDSATDTIHEYNM